MYITKRIVMITREIKFAIDAKNALERRGEFAVTTFTSARAAVDYVRQNAQDLAVIDFRVRDMHGPDVIDHMRALQPDLAIVACPDHPAVRDLQAKYNIQQLINLPYPLRKLPDVLFSAIRQMYEAQPETRSASPVQEDSSDLQPGRYSRAIEFWVSDQAEGGAEVEVVQVPDVQPDEPTSLFARLAAEEPPMPAFGEGSTIRDLHERLANPENLQRIIEAVTAEEQREVPPEPAPESAEDPHAIPAALILETALDESTPMRDFSISEFMNRVQERGQGLIAPLPSWLDEGERYIREPAFLPEMMNETGDEFTATPTVLGSGQMIEPAPGDLVTEQMPPDHGVQMQDIAPFASEPDQPAEQEPMLADEEWSEAVPEYEESAESPDDEWLDEEEIEDEYDVLEESEALDGIQSEQQPAAGFIYTQIDEELPEVAQLAVTLTQVSMELTAEATLLTRQGRIVAYAGNLPREDIQELREEIADDWEGEANRSRIRFVTLSSSGMDYMLFTRKTADDYTLSMVFAGNRPLHEIRRQGQRLVDALAVVPEVIAEPEPAPIEAEEEIEIDEESQVYLPAPEEVGECVPYTYVWVLRDANVSIHDLTARAIVRELDVNLTRSGWQIHDLDVHEDFIYLHADVPVRVDARSAVRKLMDSSAQVVATQKDVSAPDAVWDNGYLVLQPGRSMEMDEIQRFINFLRR